MNDFVKINEQHVKESSGYEVYSDGRDYLRFKDGKCNFRIRRELGWNPITRKGHEYIYVNDIYDENMANVALTPDERNRLMEKVVAAIKFMDDFEVSFVEHD
ncbi:hypothetical protein ACFFJT_09085 [Dyella flava]|uniref:Immunity protein 74 n=1 Tax=Dyella flava TaxID=1920170 RepID=A0ABS2K955_9GAMM|nr:hypothetical protein [Dyella flava]MBM7127746.1 hypothetical protein [Dyella flava]GLQ51347.1 hypothetical protein GCM10010872_27960 [Dyella flava]